MNWSYCIQDVPGSSPLPWSCKVMLIRKASCNIQCGSSNSVHSQVHKFYWDFDAWFRNGTKDYYIWNQCRFCMHSKQKWSDPWKTNKRNLFIFLEGFYGHLIWLILFLLGMSDATVFDTFWSSVYNVQASMTCWNSQTNFKMQVCSVVSLATSVNFSKSPNTMQIKACLKCTVLYVSNIFEL